MMVQGEAPKIVLMGNDRRLYRLCREIVAENGSVYEVVWADPEGDIPGGDIFIWSYQPGLERAWRLSAKSGRWHLLVIDRHELAAAGAKSFVGAAVVLKPVTKAALGAWLGQARAGHSVAGLRRDRDELLEWLMEANLRLQEYDRARTDFMAKTVHDFRAPLMAANGYCGLLLDEAMGSLAPAQREVLDRVQASLKRLARMTAAMFELSTGERAWKAPKAERSEIRAPLEQALHEIHPLAANRRIQVTMTLAPAPQPLSFEREQLEQVALNLFENACRFTPKDGRIEVQGYPFFWERRCGVPAKGLEADRRLGPKAEPNAYRVDIWNSGPAIPADRLDGIFEEYATYGAGEASPGSGLGLAICKSIIERHQGRIWAENREGGPALSFVLPFESEGRGVVSKGGAAADCQVKGAVS
jgi:signal transduction histidine kinase